MGKRKAAKKQQGPRKAEPLLTIFPCLFCNHEKSVSVALDKKAGVGHLSCKVCSQQFQCAVNYLSAAVDVYADWVDACDAVAKEDGAKKIGGGGRATQREDEDGMDDMIDDRDDEFAGRDDEDEY